MAKHRHGQNSSQTQNYNIYFLGYEVHFDATSINETCIHVSHLQSAMHQTAVIDLMQFHTDNSWRLQDSIKLHKNRTVIIGSMLTPMYHWTTKLYTMRGILEVEAVIAYLERGGTS